MKENYYAKVIIGEFFCTGSRLHTEKLSEFSFKQVSGLGNKHESSCDKIFDKSFQFIGSCYAIAMWDVVIVPKIEQATFIGNCTIKQNRRISLDRIVD